MLVLALLLVLFIIWKIYEFSYFRGEKFLSIKDRVQSYIGNCNDLNHHIEDLKRTHIGINRLDYGQADYSDRSHWNYRRPQLQNQAYAPNIYNCSRTVCDNARRQPFKYICKYFNIKTNEETLSQFEEMLNNFEAAEQGKVFLMREKESIISSIKNDIPVLIRLLSKKTLERKLGFEAVDFGTAYFPKYIFKYISSGGNTATQCEIVLDIENLNRFVNYLNETVKFRKSVAGQRSLMTSRLRRQIMERDHYTCRMCGNSTAREPNLLLEIDHIMPVSRGGLTTESNLQTLCWKCNRHKAARMP